MSVTDKPNHVTHPITMNQQTELPLAITSEALFAGGRQLLIKHESETYTLRITSRGKLILTK